MSNRKSKAICVLGMHRSGTSAITRAINLLGVDLGDMTQLIPPSSDNPEGFWEHAYIVKIHERILDELGSCWDTRFPLPDAAWWEWPNVQPLYQQLRDFVRDQFSHQPLWGWKDPRTCLLLPMWQKLMQELGIELTYLVVLRNPMDVAGSLTKRNGFSTGKSFGIWSIYTLSSLAFTHGTKRVAIHYDQFLEDWKTVLFHLADTLAIPWPKDSHELEVAMSSFLKPSLRHNRNELEDLKNEMAPRSVIRTYELCMEAIRSTSVLECSSFEQEISSLYKEYRSYAWMSEDQETSADTNIQLKAFWPKKGSYNERNSHFCKIDPNGSFHEYELVLPGDWDGKLRIDPVDAMAFVQIRSIELMKGDLGANGFRMVHAHAGNGFSGLSFERGLLKLGTRNEDLVLFAIDEDPQLQFTEDFSPAGEDVRLRVIMSISRDLDSPAIPLFVEQWQGMNEQIHLLQKELERLVFLERKLAKSQADLADREEQVSRFQKELETLREDQDYKLQQIMQDQQELLRLQTELVEQQKFSEELIHSISWRITTPLRWVGQKLRMIFR